MNTHDVSDTPQYLQLLLKQKQNLRDAQLHKGKRPEGRKSREEIINRFMLQLLMRQVRANEKFSLRSSFLPPAYTPCVSPFQDLTKVMIKDLLLESHHRGTYLLLRTVTPPTRMTAIMSIVEDENKDVLTLQLYHRGEENERAMEDNLSEGTVLIVREPYFKMMSDGDCGLRVDHLSDAMPLSMYDERIPSRWKSKLIDGNISANSWKMKGNNYFNKSNYHAAIECYTMALDSSPTIEEAHTVRINRSLAFLKVGQFDATLIDVESASIALGLTEKALYRKAQAFSNLRRHRECCEVLKVLCLEYPTNAAAKSELTRAISRLVEQETGKYRLQQLYIEASNLRPPLLDHSTYTAPVSIRPSGSRGRGLFTNRAIKAGELLFCEKAFAHAFVDTGNGAPSEAVSLLINTETDSVTMGAQPQLITSIVQKLYQNPSLASMVTDLHHGSYRPVDVSEIDGIPVVDTFLIERIVSLNCFGCPLSSRDTHIRNFIDQDSTKSTENEGSFHSCGLWPIASYINHSCCSNARRAFIGDMMIVRATRDFVPDTEITFWYQPPVAGTTYDQRQKKFRQWSFKCDCNMCQDDQTTTKGVLAKRKTMRTEAQKLYLSGKRHDTAKLETIIASLADTYFRPASEVPRLSVWDIQMGLAEMHMEHRQPAKTIHWALEALSSLGYVIDGGRLPRTMGAPMVIKQWGLMEDRLIHCWILLARAYHLVSPDIEYQAKEYAKVSYKICVGEDETFEETYGEHFQS